MYCYNCRWVYFNRELGIFYCSWFRYNSAPKNGRFANCRMRNTAKMKECPLNKDKN